jgi:hypothetical protein
VRIIVSPATRFASRCTFAVPAAAGYRPRYATSRNGVAPIAVESDGFPHVARVRPNPSLKLTRYGRRCKPGLRPLRHHRSPGLQRLPPRAA